MSLRTGVRRLGRTARRSVRGVQLHGRGHKRRRRRGISGAELRGYKKVTRLVRDALLIVPHARRGMTKHRKRGRFGDPFEGD